MRKRRQDAAAVRTAPRLMLACALALLSLAVYAVTLAPDVYSLDSPELTTAAYRLGIAHEPGYPLYVLTGWLFSHAFPIGNVAFRLNLLSAIFACVAVGLTFLVALRLTQRTVVAAAGALALGFSYWFWSDALAAEVYSLDVALFAGMLLAAVAWREQRSLPLAAAVGLLLGLGMATRTTTALFVPAVLAFAWMSGERSARSYGAAAAGMAAGLAFYAYLPIRSAVGDPFGPGAYALDGTLRVHDLSTWGGFWDHVTASSFRGEAFAYGPLGALRQTGIFSAQLVGSFLAVGVPLGIAGAVRLWRRDRGLLVLIAGSVLPATAFFINYGAIDKEFMFVPAYCAWALLMVAGIDWALEYAARSEPAVDRSLIAAAAVLALPALALFINLPLVSLHNEHRVREESETFLAAVRPGAVVYGPFMDLAPYQYLQQVEGARTDVRLVNSWTVDAGFLAALADANVGKSPFYVTQDEPALHGKYELSPVAGGYEVSAKR
jgi:hypothetical protein